MFKNYFTLNRHTIECNELLAGYSLITCFTQERDKLILHFENEKEAYFVEISTDHQTPYFLVKNRFNRAKKNTLSFFYDFLPSKLKSISIAVFDRIIKFDLESSTVYFMIRGKETNVILIKDEAKLFSFKKMKNESELLQELVNLKYSSHFQIPDFLSEKTEPFDSILFSQYPYFGKEIKAEYQRRMTLCENNDGKNVLLEILSEIKSAKPLISYDDESNKYKLSFTSNFSIQNEYRSFANLNEALHYLLINQNKMSDLEHHKKSEKTLEDKLSKLERKRDALKERIRKGCKEEYYKQLGNLLLMQVNEFKRGTTEITVENTYDSNRPIKIDLIPRFNLRENIEFYFEKAKSERKEFDKSKILLTETLANIEKVNSDHEKQKEMMNKPKHQDFDKQKISKNLSEGKKFRQFILYDKYLLYVGKNSKNNDELTTEFAKQNDFWFHARSVSGSHVVLRSGKSAEDIQKNVLEKAAAIAAFYSKAKTSRLVPVSYTQKKYVVKRKGMPAGTVMLIKEKVLLVKPEIPKECMPITE